MSLAQVIEDIFNKVEEMIGKFETIVKDGATRLDSIGTSIAGDIKTTSKEIFTNVRTRISTFIQAFKSRLRSKKFSTGGVGPEVEAFKNKLEGMLKVLMEDLQSVFDRIKKAIGSLLDDSKSEIEHVESKLTHISKDVSSEFDSKTKDFLAVLKTIGRNVGTALTRGEHFLSHELTVSKDFVYDHGLVIAESATITAFQPAILIAFGLAGAMVYGATVYEPQ